MFRSRYLLLLAAAMVCALSLFGQADSTQHLNTTTSPDVSSETAPAPPESRHFSPGFAERYKDKSFNYIEKVKKPQSTEPGFFTKLLMNLFGSNFFTAVVKLIRIGLFVLGLWLLYLLVSIFMGKNGNWLFNDKSGSLVRYGVDEDVTGDTDFSTLISKSLADGDYRTAIRYQYLHLLQKLNAGGKIEYHTEKTNADYLYEIRDQKLARSFQYVSYIYDHAWYGEFDLDANDYSRAENAFLSASKLAGHG